MHADAALARRVRADAFHLARDALCLVQQAFLLVGALLDGNDVLLDVSDDCGQQCVTEIGTQLVSNVNLLAARLDLARNDGPAAGTG